MQKSKSPEPSPEEARKKPTEAPQEKTEQVPELDDPREVKRLAAIWDQLENEAKGKVTFEQVLLAAKEQEVRQAKQPRLDLMRKIEARKAA